MDEITSPQNLIQWLPTALRKPKHLSLISAGLLLISFLVVFISLVPTFYYFPSFFLTFLREELAGPTLPMGRIFWTYFIFSTLLLNYMEVIFVVLDSVVCVTMVQCTNRGVTIMHPLLLPKSLQEVVVNALQ